MKGILASLLFASICLTPTARAQSGPFAEVVDQAFRSGSAEALDATLRQQPHDAILWVKQAGEALFVGENEELRSKREVLKESWQRVFQGDTLGRLETWYDRSRTNQRDFLRRADSALGQIYEQLQGLLQSQSKERRAYDTLITSLTDVAEGYTGVGYGLGSAQAWIYVASLYEVIPGRDAEDRREEIYAIGRFLELRRNWEWTTDDRYTAYEALLEQRKAELDAFEAEAERRLAEGYRADLTGADRFLVPNADDAEVFAPLSYEELKEPPRDVCYFGSEHPLMWTSITLMGGNTGPLRFDWFKGADLFLVRRGSVDFGITLDGANDDISANRGIDIEARTRVKDVTRFELDQTGNRPYAMWFYRAGMDEEFQGIKQNLEPRQEIATIFYRSACRWTTELDGTRLAFYDDNCNGRLFETDPEAHGILDGTIGRGPEDVVRVPAYDGMSVGNGPVVPFSEWVKVGERWFHLRGKDQGDSEHMKVANDLQVGFRPVNLSYFKTGSLQLDWSGKVPEPELLIMQGLGEMAGARFDISSGDPVEVPIGKYAIGFGRLSKGRGRRKLSCYIFAGSSGTVTVEEGGVTNVSLGGPFRLDFTKQQRGPAVEINSLTMRVRGQRGEIYSHINGATPTPDVVVSTDPEARRGRTVDGFAQIDTPEVLLKLVNRYPKIGRLAGFFPVAKGDAEGNPIIRVRLSGGQLVGLEERKNKLFGRLEPIFK